MATDTVTYCNCMFEVQQRLTFVRSMFAQKVTTGVEAFDVELVFVQLRKVLELIAFCSLTAHRETYAAVHANYAKHWKAKALLDDMARLNPDFYPVPVNEPELLPNGVKHLVPMTEGFLTKDEFVQLYDAASKVIHVRNPFTIDSPVLLLGYSTEEWVMRIERLLRLHLIHLVDGSKWIVQVPENGNVRLWSASPQGTASE